MRKMKNSGIEWIGEIPEDWKVPAVKNIFEIGRGRVIAKTELNEEGIYPVYSSQTKNNGVLGHINTYDFERSQLTWTTDGANAGTVFLREGKHNCTNVCGTLLPIVKDVDIHYLKYAIDYVSFYNKRLDTNGYKIMNNEMAKIIFPLPPYNQQIRIADYLDFRVSTIDKSIEKTKQSIEEYKEYKQSLITEVVTKGLDKNVKMKDSGIEWIGEIPEPWEMVKIKKILHEVNNRNENKEAVLLSLFTALGVAPRSSMEDKGNKASTVINYKIVEKGDLIVNKLLAWMGAIAFSDYEGVTSPDYDVYRFHKNSDVIRDYYEWYFRFTNFKDDCYRYGRGIMMMRWRTYPSEFKIIQVVKPPLEEQKKIVDFLKYKVEDIDKLINKKEKLINELEAYKKSLIYEVVTGKKEIN